MIFYKLSWLSFIDLLKILLFVFFVLDTINLDIALSILFVLAVICTFDTTV